MKKKLDDLTKAKLLYSGELFVFFLVFIVIGILILCGVIGVSDWKKWAFSIATLAGGIWLITDLIWTLNSPKRRAKSSLLDKTLPLGSAVPLLGLDIYALVNLIQDPGRTDLDMFFRIEIGAVLCYLSIVYCIESVYHFYHPTPAFLKAIEEDEKAAKEAEANQEETPKE